MSTYTHNLSAGMHLGLAHTHGVSTANIAKRAKNIALFLIAPFIGLAYLLAFPVVGFGMLAWVGGKAAMKSEKVRPVALVIAAPVIALGFVTVGPTIALVALVSTGWKALRKA